jgi:hypothetical protein
LHRIWIWNYMLCCGCISSLLSLSVTLLEFLKLQWRSCNSDSICDPKWHQISVVYHTLLLAISWKENSFRAAVDEGKVVSGHATLWRYIGETSSCILKISIGLSGHLLPGKQLPVPITEETKWALELVWMLFLPLPGN